MDFAKQQNIIDFLKKSIIKNRISHAYLFSGPKYTGKERMAYRFSKMLLCGQDKCNRCDSCHMFDRRIHPDFLEIKKGADEEIGIADIRELKNQLVSKPLISKRRIAIIFNADRLTKEAQNSSLKLLEECSAYAVIILISQNPNNLLETIVSRLVNINFQQAPFSEIEKFAGPEIANLSFGLPILAENLKENKQFLDDLKNNFKNIEKNSFGSDFDKLQYAAQLAANPQALEETIKYWLIFLRTQLLNQLLNKESGNDINYKINCSRLSEKAPKFLIKAMKSLLNVDFLVKYTSVNKQLILENLMLNYL